MTICVGAGAGSETDFSTCCQLVNEEIMRKLCAMGYEVNATTYVLRATSGFFVYTITTSVWFRNM